jgi:hypothetical protein
VTGLPEHPGEIEIVDGITGETLRRDDARQVPETVKFAPDADGRMRAVVLVRMTTVGDQREIEQIAADGTVLKRTYQRRVD